MPSPVGPTSAPARVGRQSQVRPTHRQADRAKASRAGGTSLPAATVWRCGAVRRGGRTILAIHRRGKLHPLGQRRRAKPRPTTGPRGRRQSWRFSPHSPLQIRGDATSKTAEKDAFNTKGRTVGSRAVAHGHGRAHCESRIFSEAGGMGRLLWQLVQRHFAARCQGPNGRLYWRDSVVGVWIFLPPA